jgi:hypothetical protein
MGGELAARALQRAIALADATVGAVFLVSDGEMRFVASAGFEAASQPENSLVELIGRSGIREVIEGETVVLNPPLVGGRELAGMAVPLRAAGEVIGALVIGKPGVFLVEERRALTTIAACIGPHLAEEVDALTPAT